MTLTLTLNREITPPEGEITSKVKVREITPELQQ
jgi:hypothetical protein